MASIVASGMTVLIDDNDYESVSRHRWYVHPSGYVVTNGGRANGKRKGVVFLHRFVLNPPPEKQVDHINHDKLDNCRGNLRACDQWQNQGNQSVNPERGTSQYKGVSWMASKGKWRGYIKAHGAVHYLGLFSRERDAALAYNLAAASLFGEFACLNPIEPENVGGTALRDLCAPFRVSSQIPACPESFRKWLVSNGEIMVGVAVFETAAPASRTQFKKV